MKLTKNKTLIVALSEFTTLTKSKAFLIGILMMPVFMGIAFAVQKFTRNATDIKDRHFVVVDRTGVLYGPLAAAAEEWNRASPRPACRRSRGSFRAGELRRADQQARAQLSRRVRKNELYAFVEIPPTRSIRR